MKLDILPRQSLSSCLWFAALGSVCALSACGGADYEESANDGSGVGSIPQQRPAGGRNTGSSTGGSGGSGGALVGAGGSSATEPPSRPQVMAPATNPFVSTAHDPFSTFAVDVDTASYDIFRRDINLNRLPQPNQVRLEEFVNAFRYAYPAPEPTDPTPFSVGIKAALSPFSLGSTILRVHVQGKPAAAFEKKPANLVYLMDVSGSMASSDKLGLVKQLARQSLDVLDPSDKVSIVTYSGATAVALRPTPAADKVKIRAVIDSLRAEGSTAGGSGINLAYEQAQAAFITGGINHVILCTDGDFNVGITSSDALVQLIEDKRKTGITLTALGFGADNLNDEMMERVSNAGNGIYTVISSESQAASYVRNGLLSAIEHIAQDVKVQVEFNSARVLAYRLLGYENRDIADANFRNDRVDAGEIGTGHQVTAVYELALVGGNVPMPPGAPAVKSGPAVAGAREVPATDLAMVKVRYKSPGAKEADPAREIAAHLSTEEVLQTLAAADPDMQWAVAVAAFAEILKGSPFAQRENLAAIGSMVQALAEQDPSRSEFVGLFTKALPLLQAGK